MDLQWGQTHAHRFTVGSDRFTVGSRKTLFFPHFILVFDKIHLLSIGYKNMSSKQTRKQLERDYGHLYTFKHAGNRLECAYCGDTREHLDHVPPLSAIAYYGVKRIKEREIEFMKLPSCRLCNLTLGAKRLMTYEERLVFLYNQTMEKMQHVVIWGNDEIEELDGNLKRLVAARQEKLKNDLINRIRVIENNLINVESIQKKLESC